ncbi:ABC transporter permease subunit [Rhodococcus ruber]|uniref:ABC transporter permease subunit n=1 Tax=Rhodococcus ruber TaxID=1830 RepID=A0ABT4MF66_9NOCA|nr:ABC transporter permease subunit [Rhodococcus ruber]MCZ4519334.1 ABC transporter permease subunit [Rhodococcus ruber]
MTITSIPPKPPTLASRHPQVKFAPSVIVVCVLALVWILPEPALHVPFGAAIESATNWFVDDCEWLYRPFMDLTGALFDGFLLWLQLVPAPLLCIVLIMLVWSLAGPRTAALTAAALLWVISTTLWTDLVETFALVALSVLAAAVLGFLIGVASALVSVVRAPIRVLIDAMQTIPVFVYLLPVVLVVGPGNTAAVLVTVLYAIPPMARLTDVGIRSVASGPVEAAQAIGATRWQLFRDVLFPLALPTIRSGLNQTIMLAIAMSIISAMIGASGLGDPVWQSLGRLEFGLALDAGIALVLIAVVLDRTTSASTATRSGMVHGRQRFFVTAGTIIIATIVISTIPVLRFADFSRAPTWWNFSLRGKVDVVVDWLNVSGGVVLDPLKSAMTVYVVNPAGAVLNAVPWLVVVAVVGITGVWLLGAIRGIGIAGLTASVQFLGLWTQATETVSLAGVAVAMTLVIAFPLGVLASASMPTERFLRPILDTLQTLPIFLFVIPAVVVLGSGAVPGIMATILYIAAPIVRMTCLALREVDPGPVEASASVGATFLQRLRTVKFPLGTPVILTGINQSVMMALSMTVVAAFIGAPGLGRTILVALAQVDLGTGVEAGLCMLIIATVFGLLLTGLTRKVQQAEHVE